MGAIGDAIEAVGDFVGGVIDAVVGVVVGVFSAIGSAISGIFGGLTPDVPTPNQSSSPGGVLLTKQGTDVEIPIIYGFRRVGGRIIFAETNGESNRYLYVVYVIGEGEIHKIRNIHVDDVKLPNANPAFSTNGSNNQHTVTSGRFANRMKFQLFAGTDSQSQSSLANEAPSWNAGTRKLPGVAYAVMRFEWKKIETQEDSDANPYRGGIPRVQFDVLGKKVYNVASHGSGEDLANDYADLTKTFSYNPVSCTLDYLMNPRYGCGVDKSEINADAFKTAAIKCNQKVTYATGQTGKAITMNAVVSPQSKLLENVKMMLSGARAFLPYIQGRYKIKIEDGGNDTDITSSTLTSAFDVTTDHLVGSVQLQGEKKENKYNQVIVRYVDPDKDFSEQHSVHTVAADVTADGEDLIGDFAFFTISNANMAQDIARMIYNKSRSQQYINFEATPELLAVEPGDIIRVSSDVLNLSTQTFRVTNMNFNNQGNVTVQARQHDATLYPFVSGDQIEIPADTFKPDVFNLTPISKVKPSVPIQVTPPEDQENTVTGFDSVGAPEEESPATDNDTTTPSQDEQTQGNVVSKFSLGTTTTGLLENVTGFTFPLNASIDPKGEVDFYINPPQDQTIDQFVVYHYDQSTKALISRFAQAIPRDGQPMRMFITGIRDSSYLVPRFENTSNNSEYTDGSTGTYSAIAYTDFNFSADTGKGIEAALNNAIQAVDFVRTAGRRTTVHQLA